jgi:hypothetical protein
MNNDPKTDLIYAILAMDAYNRGYGTGITELPVSGRIGNYLIRPTNTQEQANWLTAGFYAIAYKNAATGETVIAYRGTDDNIGGDKTGSSDARYGYGIALGATPNGDFNFATDQNYGDTSKFIHNIDFAFWCY